MQRSINGSTDMRKQFEGMQRCGAIKTLLRTACSTNHIAHDGQWYYAGTNCPQSANWKRYLIWFINWMQIMFGMDTKSLLIEIGALTELSTCIFPQIMVGNLKELLHRDPFNSVLCPVLDKPLAKTGTIYKPENEQ